MGTKRIPIKHLAWTPFEVVTMLRAADGTATPVPRNIRCYRNSRYTVWKRELTPVEPFGVGIHLSIKLNDRQVIHDWRDLQRIKNELVGPEVEAVELYPKDSRVVDTSNQYHLWCFPNYTFPFGQTFREVMDRNEVKGASDPNLARAEQRPLDLSDPVHSISTGFVKMKPTDRALG